MKRIVVFALVLNAALLGVIAWQLANNSKDDGWGYRYNSRIVFSSMSEFMVL